VLPANEPTYAYSADRCRNVDGSNPIAIAVAPDESFGVRRYELAMVIE
jgi:hypothetical protein